MGLVARVVEESGIPTVNVSTGRDITALVRPPRSLFVNHPMGNTFGRVGDTAMQTKILRAALDFAVTAADPGILIDLPLEWDEDFVYFAGKTTPEAIAKQMRKSPVTGPPGR
ncbi:MAG: hypothetical protein QGG19_20010 [Alphaproteobacteria bacterium]|nr:hypothetical protein [Alphaproteobacteria bacterium]MDP6253220.1 hypothetical protein [Alphaproteobacteria bacterium]MDP7055962.1 hypothetical protein [Alphaproteobacteria bacterium]MDP7230057.1 hypothetical protein [Alphaproteobacteria bacterium]MDP7458624.1 hypothetical protein [Alphaproteobacteria bacterium]